MQLPALLAALDAAPCHTVFSSATTTPEGPSDPEQVCSEDAEPTCARLLLQSCGAASPPPSSVLQRPQPLHEAVQQQGSSQPPLLLHTTPPTDPSPPRASEQALSFHDLRTTADVHRPAAASLTMQPVHSPPCSSLPPESAGAWLDSSQCPQSQINRSVPPHLVLSRPQLPHPAHAPPT